MDGNSVMRKPPAKPRHKVPAPQANEVAARLRPPPEARAGGGSGYDHPSPSIPLPVEEREASGVAAGWIRDVGSGVTFCKNRYLHIEFLKSDQAFSKAMGKWQPG